MNLYWIFLIRLYYHAWVLLSNICNCISFHCPLQATADEPDDGRDPRDSEHDDGQDLAQARQQGRRQHRPGHMQRQSVTSDTQLTLSLINSFILLLFIQ